MDLREFPRALELARQLYEEKGRLTQSVECVQIAELLGITNIAVWQAYQRGDLGVPSPNPDRARAWAMREAHYNLPDRPCRRCGGTLRRPGDNVCYDCEEAYRDRFRKP